VARIDLVGSYVTSDFKLSAGIGGSGTIITHPQGGQAQMALWHPPFPLGRYSTDLYSI
jgi:hypothetical protein